MGSTLLEIEDLGVSVEDHVILDGVNLKINKGEIHVLMGPNGTGKSTLVSSIMGDPRYEITKGKILFKDKDITDEKTDVRARSGIFLSFQTPEEIPGITLENFLRTAKGAVEGRPPKILAFRKELKAQMEALDMDPTYAERYLNVGFSGGEKKKAEILQLLMLQPRLALLDETDSGLDVDAVRTVSKGISAYHNQKNAVLIITHSAKILEGLDIDYVHVLEGGHIVKTGGRELSSEIIRSGFNSIEKGADGHESL
ncbi:Fe-S cluster assembly ATPase SufC [Muricomes intestini]|jgi:Fe-S cluster assembly ATP-binding protein|uniref:Fe-S cluster assembly ATP-binding protein n=1 Tax=Muricomes intestini TaxID=1796634 RepID=A0A4R3K3L4_9FIRM|nr:Fe-S cluster assembly ATPase SufC [Muricomes intestini]TCS77283.1 Fe-S cluster assembly ATP-binding protein [Muricomes intestini]HAX52268.1 Fe-S cluster assembly ATPase SufC [Lachnospiraceae bacterium]HCR84366.1 Fe-S cluster assembly ATPase SufC [Lachnospiraceae bacterium]